MELGHAHSETFLKYDPHLIYVCRGVAEIAKVRGTEFRSNLIFFHLHMASVYLNIIDIYIFFIYKQLVLEMLLFINRRSVGYYGLNNDPLKA